MTNPSIYADIAKRSGGDIYIGVVGPVRTGKYTPPIFFTACGTSASNCLLPPAMIFLLW